MKTRLVSLILFLLLLLGGIARAQPVSHGEFPPELEADLSAGATAVYLLQFSVAHQRLERAIQLRPDHPAPYFFMTMLYWYELTYDSLLRSDPVLERRLLEQSELSVKIAKKFSKKEGGQSVGYLYWGGALGAKGWYHSTRSQWLRAYFSGKKGYSLLLKAVDLNPELYDAYLGLGMYQYYCATLGSVLRTLASFSIRGNREEGLNLLNLAATKSKYVRLEAAYFLWNAAMDEGRLDEALSIAQDLGHRFPESPFFKWCEIQTLFYQKKWVQVIFKGEEFKTHSLKTPLPGQINSFNLLLSKVFYHCGAAAFTLGHLEQSQSYFERCVEDKTVFPGWKVMSLIRLGELRDLKGNRADAERAYREVLNLPEFWNSHSLAKERLNEPFRTEQAATSIMISPLQTWRSKVE